MLIIISAVCIVAIGVVLWIGNAIELHKYYKEANKPNVPKGEFRVGN